MTLSAALTTLETSGLIRSAQAEAELEYLFRHVLIQDAAYKSMLKADRKALHLVIGETLERQYPEQLTELASTLAHHFARAEAMPRARHYFALAGDAALSNYANAEAERHYRAALQLTDTQADRARLLSGLGETLMRQSKFQEADKLWREAITAYQSLGDYAGVARMYARAARTAGTAHADDKPRALALCREGLTVMAGQPESPALAALLHEAGRACFFNGLLDEARAFCQQALTLAERLGDVETQAETLATLWGLLPILSPQAAIAGLQRAAELAEAAGRLDTAARIHHNVGFQLGIEHGELRLGQRQIQHALILLRRIGDEAGQFYTFDVAILLAFLLGDFDEVATMLKRMTALLPSVGNRALGVTTLSGWEAWRLRCHGELGTAHAAFQTALTGFRQHQAFDTLANMSCTFAEMLLELNDLARAENVLQEVLELVERGFMEPVEPHSLLVAVYVGQGRMEAAHQALAKAQQEVGASPGVFNVLLVAQAKARLAVVERHWSAAFTAFETACAHAAQHSIRWQQAQTLREWAEAHLTRHEPGDVDRARELLHESLALFEAMNVPKYTALVNERLQSLTATFDTRHSPMPKPLLLTVDDDPQVLNAIERDLRKRYGRDYQIAKVDSGAGALDYLRQVQGRNGAVALLLADQRMPQMTGVQFLEQARVLFPQAKKVLLTAYADTEAAIAAINRVELDHYLMKPWDPPEERLYPVLDELLDDWKAHMPRPFDGIRVVGTLWSLPTHQIKDFLVRHQLPYEYLDVENDPAARALAETRNSGELKIPTILFPDGTALVEPTLQQLAEKAGLPTQSLMKFYDLIIVGGGPAGLSAAVYAASEGVDCLLIEKHAPGGQAGSSPKIENYLGFPMGISGGDLTRRALTQARRLGAEILTAQTVTAIRQLDRYKIVTLTNGEEVSGHTLLLATGASFNVLKMPGAAELTGQGIYYGAAHTEAYYYKGEEVFVVGGANSAAQGALFLGRYARQVTMLIRGPQHTAAQHLVNALRAEPKIEIRLNTDLMEVRGQDKLEAVVVKNAATGETQTLPGAAMFVFIGVKPQSELVADLVLRDPMGYVLTGPDLRLQGVEGKWPANWPLERDPFMFETIAPGLFAAGDVRFGTNHRVASAAAEAGVAVMMIRQYLKTL